MPNWFKKKQETKSSNEETLTLYKSICISCDTYPEGMKIIYHENCPKGFLKMENKSVCAGYKPRKETK
jgi:hypothetical protein